MLISCPLPFSPTSCEPTWSKLSFAFLPTFVSQRLTTVTRSRAVFFSISVFIQLYSPSFVPHRSCFLHYKENNPHSLPCTPPNRPSSSPSLRLPHSWLLLFLQHVCWLPLSMLPSKLHLQAITDAYQSTESDPADLPTLCGSHSSQVQAEIKKLCGDNTDAAMKAYKETCGSVGETVCE